MSTGVIAIDYDKGIWVGSGLREVPYLEAFEINGLLESGDIEFSNEDMDDVLAALESSHTTTIDKAVICPSSSDDVSHKNQIAEANTDIIIIPQIPSIKRKIKYCKKNGDNKGRDDSSLRRSARLREKGHR